MPETAPIDLSTFTKPYDEARKIGRSSSVVDSRDPRPSKYADADKEIVSAGRDYATGVLGLEYPALDALSDDQKAELRNYAPLQQMKRESDAYETVKNREGIEALVRESAKDDKKLGKMETLMANDDFAKVGGIAGDEWRKGYAAYLALKSQADEAIKRGPVGLDDEARAVFFGEAAKIYADGIAKGLKDQKKYTGALIDATRNAARGAFLEGRAKKSEYDGAVKRLVRKQKVKLVGAEESIADEDLDRKFNEMRSEKVASLVTSGLDKHINAGSTDDLRQGMQALREVL